MKTQIVLVMAVAAALLITTGCRTAQPTVTKLPGGPGRDGLMATGPDDAARLPGQGIAGSGVAGEGVSSADLPNEDKLFGRDLDRDTFAAQTVYFGYDRATMQAGEAAKLEQVANALKSKGADYDLLVEGHCDERGTEEYNRALGERRALAIRELLIQAGVNGNHVFTRSFGKDKPSSVGHDETAWSRNRRGEFVLVLPKKITTTQNTQ